MVNKIKHTKKIGILGGTFDPPHNGHLELARLVLKHCELDELLVMPAGVPVYKLDKQVTPASQRLEMCKLAFAGMDAVHVSDMEIKRGGNTYTAHTLLELCEQNSDASEFCEQNTETLDLCKQRVDAEFFFIVGADAAATIPKWRDAETIARLATIVVADRGHDTRTDEFENLAKNFRSIFLHAQLPKISSTKIRNAVRKGHTIKNLVPHAVKKYITEQDLYK